MPVPPVHAPKVGTVVVAWAVVLGVVVVGAVVVAAVEGVAVVVGAAVVVGPAAVVVGAAVVVDTAVVPAEELRVLLHPTASTPIAASETRPVMTRVVEVVADMGAPFRPRPPERLHILALSVCEVASGRGDP